MGAFFGRGSERASYEQVDTSRTRDAHPLYEHRAIHPQPVDTSRTRDAHPLYEHRAIQPPPKPQKRTWESPQMPGAKAERPNEATKTTWGMYFWGESVSYESPQPKKRGMETPQKPEAKAKETRETKARGAAGSSSRAEKGPNEEIMFQLSGMRYASVSKYRGMKLVSIREWYEKDGDILPGRKGINLSIDQWNTLQDLKDDINHALKTS